MNQCYSFDQALNLSNPSIYGVSANYFLYGLKNISKLITISSRVFRKLAEQISDQDGFLSCFATRESTDAVYVLGMKIKIVPIDGDVIDKQTFNSVFPDTNEEPYRKTVISN
jgi:hypothetical protein